MTVETRGLNINAENAFLAREWIFPGSWLKARALIGELEPVLKGLNETPQQHLVLTRQSHAVRRSHGATRFRGCAKKLMNITSDLLKHEVLGFLGNADLPEFADVCRRFRLLARSPAVWQWRTMRLEDDTEHTKDHVRTAAKFTDVAGHIHIKIRREQDTHHTF